MNRRKQAQIFQAMKSQKEIINQMSRKKSDKKKKEVAA